MLSLPAKSAEALKCPFGNCFFEREKSWIQLPFKDNAADATVVKVTEGD